MKHTAPEFLSNRFSIALVGVGGTGSHMLSGLARLHTALLALGHGGFSVDVFDPDRVTESNVGRQLFSPADVGQFKASILVHRTNLFYGLNWNAHARKFTSQIARDRYSRTHDIVISCVDTKAARRSIHRVARSCHDRRYWLDLGNDARTGQVVLGEVESGKRARNKEARRLPTVLELFPEMSRKDSQEDLTPSCSLAESLERQDLFINQTVATFALDLLWQLLRRGGIDHHGAFINLTTGRVTPLPIDPEAWQRMADAESVTRQRKKVGRKTPAKRGTRSAKQLTTA